MRLSFISILFLVAGYASAQRPGELNQFLESVRNEDSFQSDIHWQIILDAGQPITWNDSAAFIYKGEASSVIWNGDFNKWGVDTTFLNKGQRILNSNYWILFAEFPEDARIDYKVIIDREWIIDPFNKHRNIVINSITNTGIKLLVAADVSGLRPLYLH